MNYENTRIHQKILELHRLSRAVVIPADADLADQMKRASRSVALRFAEGCGRSTPRDRARFFAMARGSAAEVSMIFDVAHAEHLIDDETCARGKDLCDHIGGMLYKYR